MLLGNAMDVQIDFSQGFSSAPATFKIVKTLGVVNEESVMKIARSIAVGPEYIKNVAIKLDLYFKKLEKKKQETWSVQVCENLFVM